MAPVLQSLSFGSDCDDHFVLCTLKVPIPKSFNGFTLINTLEGEKLLSNIIKDELVNFVTSKGKCSKIKADDQKDNGSSSDGVTERRDSLSIDTDTSKPGQEMESPESFNASNDNDIHAKSQSIKDGKSLCQNKEKSPDSSLNLSNDRSPQSSSGMKEEKTTDVKLSSSDYNQCQPTNDFITLENVKGVVKEQLRTWDLSKQGLTMKDTKIPAFSSSRKQDVDETSAKMEGVQFTNPWNNFIDLADSFGLGEISIPLNNVAYTNTIDYTYRDLNRYHSCSSSSGGSDLDWSFDGFVPNQECEGNQVNASDTQQDTNMQTSMEGEDTLDFQSLLDALSEPVDQCTTETIRDILQQESQTGEGPNLGQKNTFEISSIIQTDNKEAHESWTDAEAQLYRELMSLTDELAHLKKKTGPRKRPNQCYHLWDFLRDELGKKNDYMEWVNEEKREFRILDTKKIANAWGNKKRSHNMNYDKLSRSLRYYCKLRILEKIPGKRLHFKFGDGKMWTKV